MVSAITDILISTTSQDINIPPILKVWIYDLMVLHSMTMKDVRATYYAVNMMTGIHTFLERNHFNFAAVFMLIFMLCLSYMVYTEADKYRNSSSEPTFFAYKETPFNTSVVNRIKTRVGEYQRPWWYNCHIGNHYFISAMYTTNLTL
jgi:hypothetical protein